MKFPIVQKKSAGSGETLADSKKEGGFECSFSLHRILGRDPRSDMNIIIMISFGEKISGGGISTVRLDTRKTDAAPPL